jgi:thiol-disulfide isomerase/thioredoxin
MTADLLTGLSKLELASYERRLTNFGPGTHRIAFCLTGKRHDAEHTLQESLPVVIATIDTVAMATHLSSGAVLPVRRSDIIDISSVTVPAEEERTHLQCGGAALRGYATVCPPPRSRSSGRRIRKWFNAFGITCRFSHRFRWNRRRCALRSSPRRSIGRSATGYRSLNGRKGTAMNRRALAVLAALAVILAACGSESGSKPSAAPSATAAASPTPASNQSPAGKHVPAQLQFSAKTVDGQDFSGESLLGKPAVLWFWTPWCPTCQRESPMVGKVADTHPAVTFVGVGAQEELPAIQEFVNKYPVKGFRNLADPDSLVWEKFGVTHQPAYAFINADGIIDVVKGSISEAELTKRVEALSHQ